MFECSGFGRCRLDCEDDGRKPVIVEVMVPPSNCEFTFCGNGLKELPEF